MIFSFSIFLVVKYEVTVITGDVEFAASDSNIFISIYGDSGDTGKRWLKKPTSPQEPFAKGSVSNQIRINESIS